MARFKVASGKTGKNHNYVYQGFINANSQFDSLGYVCWDNTEYYFGEWLNGNRTGKGCYYFPDQNVYLGNFKKANKDGLGLMSKANNEFYFGYYSNNLKNGLGVYIFDNGDWIYGNFSNDKIHGKAVRFNAKTKTFEFNFYENGSEKEEKIIDEPIGIVGNWNNSQISLHTPSSQPFIYDNGTNSKGTKWEYNGQIDKDSKWNNIGLIEWLNDSYYFGEWKDNRRQGVGLLEFSSRDYYIGNFDGVNFHGKGIYRNVEKKKTYFSTYRNHLQEGHMFILYDDGNLYYGNAINDKLEGDVFIVDPNFGVTYNTYRNGSYVSEEKAFPFELSHLNNNSNSSSNSNSFYNLLQQLNNSRSGQQVSDEGGKQNKQPDQPQINANEELEALIGLKNVKTELKRIKAYTVKNKNKNVNLHMAFLGNPGTGKTAVARLIAQILYEAGVLKNNKFVECSRQTLVAMYIGETALKTKKVIDEAMGGVLFIDEAYSLYQDSEKDFGKEAIVELLKAMEDHRGEFCCIMAGYTNEMNRLFSANPGFKSRVQFHVKFPDYSKDELMQIGKKMLTQMDYQMDDDAIKLAVEIACKNQHQPNFANAREVRNILEKTAVIQALRTADEMENRTIILEDVSLYAKENNIDCSNHEENLEPMVKIEYLMELANRHIHKSVTDQLNDIEEAVISLSVEMPKGKSESSGFLITPCGYAVTCAHCVNDAITVTARRRIKDHRNNQIDLFYKAQVLAVDKEADVAIIKLLNLTGDNAYIDLLPKGAIDYDTLDNIIMLGYPFGVSRFDNISTNVGKIVSYQKRNDGPDFINIDLSAKSGNSGSAVLNLEHSYAIGVLCGGSLNNNGSLVEEVNYCRPISYVWDLIEKNQK